MLGSGDLPATSAGADPLNGNVAFERGILMQHELVQVTQGRAEFHTVFLPPAVLGLEVGRQGVRLPPRAVQCAQVKLKHEFVRWVLPSQFRNLAH